LSSSNKIEKKTIDINAKINFKISSWQKRNSIKIEKIIINWLNIYWLIWRLHNDEYFYYQHLDFIKYYPNLIRYLHVIKRQKFLIKMSTPLNCFFLCVDYWIYNYLKCIKYDNSLSVSLWP